VPAGSQQIVLLYLPNSFLLGGAISLLTLFGAIAVWKLEPHRMVIENEIPLVRPRHPRPQPEIALPSVSLPPSMPTLTPRTVLAEPNLSLVVPVYNEEGTIDAFTARLAPVLEGLGLSYELVFVDDGSRDSTLAKLLELRKQDSRVKVLSLSRNFGKDVAL